MLMYSQTRHVVYGFILKMKQINLILVLRAMMLLNFSSIRLNYYETQLQMEQMEF